VPAKVLTRLTRPPHVVHFGALAKTPGRKMRAACGLAQRGAGLVHVRFPQASHKPENLRPRSGRRHMPVPPLNMFSRNMFSRNMFSRNMFSRNMFSRNMFSRNMFSRNECFQHFHSSKCRLFFRIGGYFSDPGQGSLFHPCVRAWHHAAKGAKPLGVVGHPEGAKVQFCCAGMVQCFRA
jgi:hypothetical protein